MTEYYRIIAIGKYIKTILQSKMSMFRKNSIHNYVQAIIRKRLYTTKKRGHHGFWVGCKSSIITATVLLRRDFIDYIDGKQKVCVWKPYLQYF